MQSNLRIIDPLYGALRPLDLIQPYRLEMASKDILSKSEIGSHKSLASWWSESITTSIINDLEIECNNDKVVINLASDEYSSAINSNNLSEKCRYMKIVFQQDGRVIAVHAKRARGLMVRYIAENYITDAMSIHKFDLEGYEFVSSRSKSDLLVFDRAKNWSEKGKRKEKNDGNVSSKKKARKKN